MTTPEITRTWKNKKKLEFYSTYLKEFHIKWTAHIVNLKENDDTGNNKNIKEEDDPHKAWRQETNDKKSKEVIERVKLLKVQDPIMNPDKPKTHSPFSDFVNFRTSFDWTAK